MPLAPSSGPWPAGQVQTDVQAGAEPPLVVQRKDEGNGRGPSLSGPHASLVLDAVLVDLGTDADRSRDGAGSEANEALPLPRAGDAPDGLGPDGIRSDEARPDPVSRPVEIPRVEGDLIRRRLGVVLVSGAVLDELAAEAVG